MFLTKDPLLVFPLTLSTFGELDDVVIVDGCVPHRCGISGQLGLIWRPDSGHSDQ